MEHLERQCAMEKYDQEVAEQWRLLVDSELVSLRIFFSDFSYLKHPEDNEVLSSFADNDEFIEAGFLEELPLSVLFSCLNELLYYASPAGTVEEAYIFERELFFVHTGLTLKESLDDLHFQFFWKKASLIFCENLFTEILVRGDLILESPAQAYLLIGDYGTRTLKFYAKLEGNLDRRRQRSEIHGTTMRKLEGHSLMSGVKEQFSSWNELQLAEWKSQFSEWQQIVEELQGQFASQNWLHDLVKQCQVRTTAIQRMDVHPASYLRLNSAVKARLEAKVSAKNSSELPPLNIDGECSLHPPQGDNVLEPLCRILLDLKAWIIPSLDSVQAMDQHYLGMWQHLFSDKCKEPFPTWEAIAWIGKDHTLIDRTPRIPLRLSDILNVMRQSSVAPISVRSDPNFCHCPRRCLWPVDAKLDFVFYNWPVIPGDFETLDLCIESYNKFSTEHHFHRDPVCFRASIFTTILAFWCGETRVTIVYKVGARFSTDMLVYNSIQFHSSRRIRMLELMCQTQFLRDAHDAMIGDSYEEIGTRQSLSFNCIDKHEHLKESRRSLGARLKAEEGVKLNTHSTEMARVQRRETKTALAVVKTEL